MQEISKTVTMVDVKRDITRELATVKWDEQFRPPEGGDVPAETELRGFREDARGIITSRIDERFAGQNSINRTELGDLLTEIAYEQKSNSAGPFIRFFTLGLRDRVLCKDYLKDKAAAEFAETVSQPVETSLLIGKVMDEIGNPTEEHMGVIGDLHNELNGYGVATPKVFVDAANKVLDAYESNAYDDGYLADFAQEVRDAAIKGYIC